MKKRGKIPWRASHGFSLIEVMVAVGMLLIVALTALSSIRRSVYDLDGAVVEVQGSLRLTRSLAASRGVHYRFTITSPSTFEVQRLEEFGGVWLLSSERKIRTLPAGIRIDNAPGTTFEFDARGMLPDLPGPTVLTVRDQTTGAARVLSLWPSGQVIG